MAKITDPQGFMGGFSFYNLNGQLVMRKKRAKLSEEEKKEAAKTKHGKAGKGNRDGSKFGSFLREFKAYKFQADSCYHSRMTGFITQHLMTHRPDIDGLGTRLILPENVDRISEFTANSVFPKKILDALRKTQFKKSEQGINVVIPPLPIEVLVARKAEHYRVWVTLKILDVKEPGLGWSQKIYSEPLVFGEKSILSFPFSPPETMENEVLMAIVGVKSLVNGKMIEDKRMNGFVYLAVSK